MTGKFDAKLGSPYQQPSSVPNAQAIPAGSGICFRTTSMATIPDLPSPGSISLLPSLLAHIRAVAPGLPFEPIIIQVLLLCIVSGDRNLILRTREEDIGLVSRLAAIVSVRPGWFNPCEPASQLTMQSLTSVFGYITHKLKCHADAKSQTSTEFLRSLFLPPPAATVSDGSLLPHNHHRHHRSSSRNYSFPRSTSFPGDARLIQVQRNLQLDDPTGADVPPTQTPSISTPPSLHTVGVYTESSVPNFTSSGNQRHTHIKIPSAIVVSGLEHASLPAQRAVLQTLAEKKLVLDGNLPDIEPGLRLDLPDDFIMVYVCRLDPHERPPIYSSLVCTLSCGIVSQLMCFSLTGLL